MQVAIVPEPGRIELVDAPVPTPNEYEALVEILTCSICSGTDTHIVHDQFPMRAYPCVLGHESIGRVIECGSAVRNLKPGAGGKLAVGPARGVGGWPVSLDEREPDGAWECNALAGPAGRADQRIGRRRVRGTLGLRRSCRGGAGRRSRRLPG